MSSGRDDRNPVPLVTVPSVAIPPRESTEAPSFETGSTTEVSEPNTAFSAVEARSAATPFSADAKELIGAVKADVEVNDAADALAASSGDEAARSAIEAARAVAAEARAPASDNAAADAKSAIEAAEARAAASDKAAADAKSAIEAAEARAAASDKAAADAKSENICDRAIAAAQQATMRSHAEASDRHAKMTTFLSINAFFDKLAPEKLADSRRGWAALRACNPPLPTVADDEKPAMHDLIGKILDIALECAQQSSKTKLVLYHERKAKINDSTACVIPDWVAAHLRDRSFCMHAMLFGLEAKNRKPENVSVGQAQGMDYVLRLASYRDDQLNEGGCRGRSRAFAAFSNGENIQFFSLRLSRVTSDSEHVTMTSTELLELVPLSVFNGGAWPVEPTPGFTALVRMLSSSAEQLGELEALKSSVFFPGAGVVSLNDRIALGGFCDVYEGTLPSGGLAAVKLPRYRSAQVCADLANEASALVALQQSPCQHIPELILPTAPPRPFTPPRSRSAGSMSSSGVSAGRAALLDTWDPALDNFTFPAGLVSLPLGTPLVQVMAELLDREFPSPAACEAQMAALADHVFAGLHSALCHAHRIGLLHCDVRPQNVVLVAGNRTDWLDSRVVLVDWALAVPLGSRHGTSRNGVAAYLHADLAVPGSPWTARQKHDLCAAAYTAATIACGTTNGHHVATPWCGMHFKGTGSAAVVARNAWFASGVRVARQCSAYLGAIEAWDALWQWPGNSGPNPPKLQVSSR